MTAAALSRCWKHKGLGQILCQSCVNQFNPPIGAESSLSSIFVSLRFPRFVLCPSLLESSRALFSVRFGDNAG